MHREFLFCSVLRQDLIYPRLASTQCITEEELKFLILLPRPPQFGAYRSVPLHLVPEGLGMELRLCASYAPTLPAELIAQDGIYQVMAFLCVRSIHVGLKD